MSCPKCGNTLQPNGLCPLWKEHRRHAIKNHKTEQPKPEAYNNKNNKRQF